MVHEDCIFFFIKYLSKVLKADSYVVQFVNSGRYVLYQAVQFCGGFVLEFIDKNF